MDSPPNLETVYQAVFSLYNNTNPAEPGKASLWLGELQRSVSTRSLLISLDVEVLPRALPEFDRSHSDLGHERISRCARVNGAVNQKYGKPLSNLERRDYHIVMKIYFAYRIVKRAN